jgi:hypothetical protein
VVSWLVVDGLVTRRLSLDYAWKLEEGTKQYGRAPYYFLQNTSLAGGVCIAGCCMGAW